MATIALFDYASLMVSGILITLTFMCALLYLYRSSQQDEKRSKEFLLAFGIFYLSIAINLCINYFMYLHVEGFYEGHVYYAYFENGAVIIRNQFEYEMIIRLAQAALQVGWFGICFLIEKNIKKTKYAFTIVLTIGGIATFFMPLNMAFIFSSYLMTIFYIFIISVLIYFIRTSKPNLKAIGSLLFFGIIISLFATTIGGDTGKSLNIFPLSFALLLNIISIIIVMLPLLLRDSQFSNALRINYLVSGVSVTLMLVIYFGIFFIGFDELDEVGRSIYINQGLIFSPFMAIVLILSYVSIRKGMNQEQAIRNNKLMNQDILSTFTKPKKLTEEEVSVAKERQICLVCKGKLDRTIYLCPGCSAFYCEKCSSTLAGLENECWSCGMPFDESKPIKKMSSTEGIEIDLKEKGHKKEKSK